MRTTKIAIFASGSGTNAENLTRNFQGVKDLEVAVILTNKKDAFVIQRAKNLNVPYEVFSKTDFADSESQTVLKLLAQYKIDFVVLAGFLLKVPQFFIENYSNRIINIHPSLLPKYGGKGMYGQHVHEAVIAAKEKASGITIHLVNEEYDKGKVLFQATCEVSTDDSATDLAAKIHQLEYEHFPKIVANYINGFQ
ncbi:MAG: phosphoribosylglycinamide formyltransferase [Bacteroidota bacterium]